MKTKDEIARALAEAHRRMEPRILRITRIRTADEDDAAEPVKLLEVNPDTTPSGIVPVSFGPAEGIPFPAIIVEVTPDEFGMLSRQDLRLPSGWQIGETLFAATG